MDPFLCGCSSDCARSHPSSRLPLSGGPAAVVAHGRRVSSAHASTCSQMGLSSCRSPPQGIAAPLKPMQHQQPPLAATAGALAPQLHLLRAPLPSSLAMPMQPWRPWSFPNLSSCNCCRGQPLSHACMEAAMTTTVATTPLRSRQLPLVVVPHALPCWPRGSLAPPGESRALRRERRRLAQTILSHLRTRACSGSAELRRIPPCSPGEKIGRGRREGGERRRLREIGKGRRRLRRYGALTRKGKEERGEEA